MECLSRGNSKGLVSLNRNHTNTRANSKTENTMDRGSILGIQEISMKVDMKMVKSMDMEFIKALMDQFIRDNGSKERGMGKG